MTKNVFLSYSDADREIAVQVRQGLKDLLGDELWMREFNLDGGSLIVEEIGSAVEDSNWLIVLLSEKSLECQWLRLELDLATLRAIEDLGVKLILVYLDDSKLPKHLEIPLKNQLSVSLHGLIDFYPEVFRIAEYIVNESAELKQNQVYVDRGESGDQFSLLSRRNSIIFVLGWAGIGKSSFVHQTVAKQLRKAPLTVALTLGSSIDFLARQLLRKTHVDQQINDTTVSDKDLLAKAVEAVRLRSTKFFVFIDNAELALDGSNELLPVLNDFLEAFLSADIRTHVVLATTRSPRYSAAIAEQADLMNLGTLSSQYAKESIDLWLEGEPNYVDLVNQPSFDEVIGLTGGHPLAAKLLASYLKVKPAVDLLIDSEKQLFELQLARHILKSSDHLIITGLQRLMLSILSIVQDPMTFEDLLTSSDLAKYPLDEIRKAKLSLSSNLLIEQDGEFLKLHSFLITYFRDQLEANKDLYERVARDIGLHHFDKVTVLNGQLTEILFEEQNIEGNEEVSRLSNELFRYAIPAERLLLSIGEDGKAAELPLHIKGTLREMVFYFYQEKRDFDKALYFAEQWLHISPNDSDILLYQARCYANRREKKSTAKAELILNKLDSPGISLYFETRILETRGKMARADGKLEKAKEYFESGIKLDRKYPFVGNYVGLARVLLDEANQLATDDSRRLGILNRAIGYLKKARTLDIPVFERFHIGFFIELLLEAGDFDQADTLIRDALRDRPDDARLNYAMAEIMRKNDQVDEAEAFARKAIKMGSTKSPLSLANILHDQGIRALLDRHDNTASQKFQEALETLAKFRPEYGDDDEVCAVTMSKIYRAMADYQKAIEALSKYAESSRSHTVYEYCKTYYAEAQQFEKRGKKREASRSLTEAKRRLTTFRAMNRPGPELTVLSEEIERMKNRVDSD